MLVNDGVLVFQGDLVAAGILSGNRNFEGRVHPNTRANYLASPPLVIAYAIAGTVRIDFDTEPIGGLGKDHDGGAFKQEFRMGTLNTISLLFSSSSKRWHTARSVQELQGPCWRSRTPAVLSYC